MLASICLDEVAPERELKTLMSFSGPNAQVHFASCKEGHEARSKSVFVTSRLESLVIVPTYSSWSSGPESVPM